MDDISLADIASGTAFLCFGYGMTALAGLLGQLL